MDNLPKNPNDISNFAGNYPDPSVVQPQVPPQPSQGAPIPEQPMPQAFPEIPVPVQDVNANVYQQQVAPAENPFVVQVDQQPGGTGGGGAKRILGVLILLIVLAGAGFFAFKYLGKFFTGLKSTTITYWGLWENDEVFKSLIAEYKKNHPKIDIVYSKQSPKQYRERLQAAIKRGDGPDIFRFHNTWVPMLKEELTPAGKTGYSVADFQQIFYPVANKDLVVGGKVYGVPLMFDGLALYYNEDLLRAAGVTPPTSWEAFRTAALTLTVKDQTGKIVTAGAALGSTGNIEHFSDILGVMMLQNGADLKNPVGKEAQDALSFYHLFAEKPNNTWDETLDNSILSFANGKVAFIFAPSWQVFNIREINPNLKFQIIPIPQLPGTNVSWASYWVEGVSSKSKFEDESWEFLKFISSKESMISLYTEITKLKERPFGEPYSRIDLAQTVINDPLVGAYIRQAPAADTFYLASRTFDNGINDHMIKYLEDGVNSLGKGVSIQGALETAAKGFQQVLSQYGATAK